MDKYSTGVEIVIFIGVLGALLFVILSMFLPFVIHDNKKYTVIGITGEDTVGCLGACPSNNNNCIGDDASAQCQVVQCFYIISSILLGFSFFLILYNLSSHDNNNNKRIIRNIYCSLCAISCIMMFVSLLVLTCSPIGFNTTESSSAQKLKDGSLREGFYLTLFSIVFLIMILVFCGVIRKN